jgi:hypothetical protein
VTAQVYITSFMPIFSGVQLVHSQVLTQGVSDLEHLGKEQTRSIFKFTQRKTSGI